MPESLRTGKGEGEGSFPTGENACVRDSMFVSIMTWLGIALYESEVFLHSLNLILTYECAGHQWPGFERELL